jgi:hypothetical protein
MEVKAMGSASRTMAEEEILLVGCRQGRRGNVITRRSDGLTKEKELKGWEVIWVLRACSLRQRHVFFHTEKDD